MRVVPVESSHIVTPRGDPMKKKEPEEPKKLEYAATYKLGKTTVHVVAPPERTEEEREEILKGIRAAAWAIIDECVERGEEV